MTVASLGTGRAAVTAPPPADPTPYVFRALWPITDESMPWADLITQAVADLPVLARIHRARVVGRGRFSVARSVDVPGSGRVTPSVLVYEAPAVPRPTRAYHLRAVRKVAD